MPETTFNSSATHPLLPPIEKMLQQLTKLDSQRQTPDSTPAIHINQTVGSAALLYEKIRNTVGYQEEQILRRLAIERILTRRSIFQRQSAHIATGLIWELIQAGYLKNDAVPETTITGIAQIIDKYLALEKALPHLWTGQIFGVAATEIENQLVHAERDEILLTTLYNTARQQLAAVSPESQELLYIAFCRLFFKSDRAATRYYLLCHYYPAWSSLLTNDISKRRDELIPLIERIEHSLTATIDSHLLKFAKKYYCQFVILQNIIQEPPIKAREILSSSSKLTSRVNQITTLYFNSAISRLNRSMLKAVLFILITKVVIGMLLEIPYDQYFLGHINYQPLLINVIFPPLLMFFSVYLVKVPGKENSQKILEQLRQTIYSGSSSEPTNNYVSQYVHSRHRTLSTVLNTLYSITFLATITALAWLLIWLRFNLVSGILFFFFLCIVSFLAFRIRQGATDMTVVAERENILATLLDFLLLPFLKIGHWLSRRFEKANVFLFIFDFVLEAPFKTILEVIEHWADFLREKKEEITA